MFNFIKNLFKLKIYFVGCWKNDDIWAIEGMKLTLKGEDVNE